MSVNRFGSRRRESCKCDFLLRSGNVREAYVNHQDALRVLKAGDTMTGNLLLSIGSDSIRQLGCTDLTSGKGFSLPLGNVRNQLQFAVIPAEQTQTPVTLETTHGFLVRSANQDVCHLGNADNPSVLTIYKNVVMNSHSIKQLPDPTDDQDAATKYYVDTVLHKDVYRAMKENVATGVLEYMVLSIFNDPSQGSANSLRLQSGLNQILVVGKRSGPSCNVYLKLVGQDGFARTCEVTTSEFEFTAVIKLTSATNMGLGVRHQTAEAQLNIEATLVIARL